MVLKFGAKKWFMFVISILLLTDLAILLNILFLRQIIGFVFLTILPGLLIIQTLKLDKLCTIETLLYSVGLSIAFVMFLGLFMNMLYPFIGIYKPISILPVIVTITSIVLILCIAIYKREKHCEGYSFQSLHLDWSELISSPALFLFLLPFLSALGSFLVFSFHCNAVLLILLALIALIPILIAFGKFIPEKLYPLAVVAISIALLWQRSLLSFDLPSGDILVEYYYQWVVLRNSLWNPNIAANVNAMLSVVMLPPIYSIVLNLNTVWVYKIIYPLFYSLVPLALFQVYKKQTNDKVAFLAAFFFMSFPEFMFTMPLLARQIVAELFVALSLILFLGEGMNATKRALLLIIFGVSIVTSHYGLSYIYMLYLIIALPILLLLKSNAVNELWESILAKFHRLNETTNVHTLLKPTNWFQQRSTLNVTYVMIFIVFCLSWYMYITSGSPFNSVIRIGDHIYGSLSTELFFWGARDPNIAQAMGLAPMRSVDVEWRIARIFQYITQLFIVVGIIDLIFKHRKTKFHPEYAAMSFMSMVLLAMCIIIPHFAAALNMTRLYHITLIFLAPFCILGGIALFRCLSRILRVLRVHVLQNVFTSSSLKLVVILVLVPYFLFTSGFIFELTGATPTSAPLSYGKADWPFYTKAEIQATDWRLMILEDKVVECDAFSHGLVSYRRIHSRYEVRTGVKSAGSPNDVKDIDNSSYIFLRRWNVIHGGLLSGREQGKAFIYKSIEEIGLLKNSDKIYDNNEAQVWRRSK